MLQMWSSLPWNDIISWCFSVLLVAVAVEAIAEIITSGEIFTWVRRFAARLAAPADPSAARWYWSLLFKLVTCGYCCSVWLAVALAFGVPGGWFGLLPWDNILIKIFLVHRLSNLYHSAFELLRRGRVGTYDIKLVVYDHRTEASGYRDGIGEVDDVDLRDHGTGIGAPVEETGTRDFQAGGGPQPHRPEEGGL